MENMALWRPWIFAEGACGPVSTYTGIATPVRVYITERPAVVRHASIKVRGFVAHIQLVSCASAASATKQTLSTAWRPLPQRISWIRTAERKLEEMRNWRASWDRQNAVPFTSETIRSAQQLLRQMLRFYPEYSRGRVPELVPLPDGSIRFELRSGEKELFLTVLGTTVEAQRWYPLNDIHSIDYAEVPLDGVGPALEWLTT